jgi:hypothetical protein
MHDAEATRTLHLPMLVGDVIQWNPFHPNPALYFGYFGYFGYFVARHLTFNSRYDDAKQLLMRQPLSMQVYGDAMGKMRSNKRRCVATTWEVVAA